MIWGNSDPCHPSPVCNGGVKNGRFWGQNQVTMAGSPRDPGINIETLQRLKSYLNIDSKIWFWVSLTLAILPACENENMVKYPLWLLHPSPVCMGGSKMPDFEVKIRSKWKGHTSRLGMSGGVKIKSAIFDPPVHRQEGWQGLSRL